MNITKERINAVFNELFGERAIDRIDVVSKVSQKGEKYQRAFVHFREWPSTREAQEVRRQLLDDKEVKIVYDAPWFWKCSASQSKRPEERDTKPRGPYIVTDERDQEVRPREDERRRDYRPREDERRRDYRPREEDDYPRGYDPRHDEVHRRPRGSYCYRSREDDIRDDRELRETYDSRRDERDRRYNAIASRTHKPTYQPTTTGRPATKKPSLKIDTTVTEAETKNLLAKITRAEAPVSPPYNPTTPPHTPPRKQEIDQSEEAPKPPGAPKKARAIKFVISEDEEAEAETTSE